MSYVIQRNPNDPVNKEWSPWKGCLYIAEDGKPWYATSLAKPTLFQNKRDADATLDSIRECSGDEFVVGVYEEIFQIKMPIVEPTQPNVISGETQRSTTEFDWGDDDIPF